MRIAVNCLWYDSRRETGVERYATYLLEALDSLPHSVTVVIGPDCQVKLRGGRVVVGSVPRRPRLAREQICLFPDTDLLITPAYVPPLGYPGKQILVVHDLAHVAFPETVPLRARIYLRTLLAAGMRRSAAVVTDSETVLSEVSRRYPDLQRKLHRIYPPVPPWSQSPGVVSDPLPCDLNSPYLLAVGTGRRKNVEVLVQGFELSGLTSHKLVVIGSGVSRVRSRVIFPGRVSDGALTTLYQGTAGFIFPSIYEGFGLPLLEAARFNVPILCSDIPVFREIAGGHARYVSNFHSPSAWARALNAFVLGSDAGSRALMDARFARNAFVNSWDQVIREVGRGGRT